MTDVVATDPIGASNNGREIFERGGIRGQAVEDALGLHRKALGSRHSSMVLRIDTVVSV